MNSIASFAQKHTLAQTLGTLFNSIIQFICSGDTTLGDFNSLQLLPIGRCLFSSIKQHCILFSLMKKSGIHFLTPSFFLFLPFAKENLSDSFLIAENKYQ